MDCRDSGFYLWVEPTSVRATSWWAEADCSAKKVEVFCRSQGERGGSCVGRRRGDASKTQSTFSRTSTPRLQLLASRTQSLPVPLKSSPSSSALSPLSTQPMSHVLSASRSGHPSSSASSSHSFMPPTPSVRDTHSFDLAFAPFQERCSAFLSSLDSYVLRGKEEIQARRASHTTTLRKAAEEQARLEKEIDGEGDKESRLLKVLEKEKNEVRDFEQALAELKLSLGGVETQIKIGEGDAQERETQIATLKKGQSALPLIKLTFVERGPAYLRLARLSFDACRESHAGGVPRGHAQDRRCRPGRRRGQPLHQDRGSQE